MLEARLWFRFCAEKVSLAKIGVLGRDDRIGKLALAIDKVCINMLYLKHNGGSLVDLRGTVSRNGAPCYASRLPALKAIYGFC